MKEREMGGGKVAELNRAVREGPSEKLFEKRLVVQSLSRV